MMNLTAERTAATKFTERGVMKLSSEKLVHIIALVMQK